MIPFLVILTSIFAILRASSMLKIPWVWVWSPLWIKALLIIIQLTFAIAALLLGSELVEGYIQFLENTSF